MSEATIKSKELMKCMNQSAKSTNQKLCRFGETAERSSDSCFYIHFYNVIRVFSLAVW